MLGVFASFRRFGTSQNIHLRQRCPFLCTFIFVGTRNRNPLDSKHTPHNSNLCTNMPTIWNLHWFPWLWLTSKTVNKFHYTFVSWEQGNEKAFGNWRIRSVSNFCAGSNESDLAHRAWKCRNLIFHFPYRSRTDHCRAPLYFGSLPNKFLRHLLGRISGGHLVSFFKRWQHIDDPLPRFTDFVLIIAYIAYKLKVLS